MLYGKKKYEEDYNYTMEKYEDYVNNRNWVDNLLNVMEENNETREDNALSCMSWDSDVFFVNAVKSYLIDKDVESFKQNMYIGTKLSIMGEEARNFLVCGRRYMFRILASNNQDLINFIKKYNNLLTYRKRKDKFLKSDIYSYLTKTILSAFLGKWGEVKERCNIYYQNKPASGYYNLASVEFDFLKALAEKNIEKMQESIEIMLDKKIARKLVYNMDRNFEFWLQMYAVMYLKIALYHGYDLGIDCDICPKDLIDNTPAKEYPEPFEFMNEFNLNTITPEEWKEWIYNYYNDKERLLENEKAGYFI